MSNILKRAFAATMMIAMSIAMSVSVFADEGAGGAQNPQGNWLFMLIYFGIIIGFFYLVLYRPQKKKMKKEEEMRDAVIVGDEVIMTSGIMGKVLNIKDDEVVIETGAGKTQIKFTRSAIGRVLKSNANEEKSVDDKKAEIQARKNEEKEASEDK